MGLRSRSPLPSFDGVTEWIGGAPSLAPSFPLLVHFWSVSCPLCHENMQTVHAWREMYASRGLQFVAIHLPFKDADWDLEVVRQTSQALSISEPLGVDGCKVVSQAFDCDWAPEYFLFDADWKLRSRAAGLFGLNAISRALETMYRS